MGIPYYFSVITKTAGHTLKETVPDSQPKTLFLDYNGVIHQAVREYLTKNDKYNEEIIFKAIWEYTERVVDVINPTRTYIMIDGVAPIAKMCQQRKRRYINTLRNKVLEIKSVFDTNAISPGTEFMNKLQTYLQLKIKTRTNWFLSASNEPGEGEQKIFQVLKKEQNNGLTVIYGLDADLIMLSLLSGIKQIYLMRESGTMFTYLDIDELTTAITDYSKISMTEYVVICFLLGNDFLPNLTALNLKRNGLDTIIKAYQDSNKQIIVNNRVNIDALQSLFEKLSTQEDQLVWNVNKEYLEKTVHSTDSKERFELYPILPENKAQVAYEIQSNSKWWREIYYKRLFMVKSISPTGPTINTACRLYIQGIAWIYEYYCGNKRCQSKNDWYYPYSYAPTILDLNNLLEGLVTPETLFEVNSSPEFVDSETQLATILPPASHHLLNAETKKKAIQNRHKYATEYKVHTYLKTHLHEVIPILPAL